MIDLHKSVCKETPSDNPFALEHGIVYYAEFILVENKQMIMTLINEGSILPIYEKSSFLPFT